MVHRTAGSNCRTEDTQNRRVLMLCPSQLPSWQRAGWRRTCRENVGEGARDRVVSLELNALPCSFPRAAALPCFCVRHNEMRHHEPQPTWPTAVTDHIKQEKRHRALLSIARPEPTDRSLGLPDTWTIHSYADTDSWLLARYEYLTQSSQRGAAAQTNDHEEPGLPDMVAGATQRLTNRAAEVSAILHPNCQK